MAERQGELCPFSGHAIAIDDMAIPVECPICGSIRKTQVKERKRRLTFLMSESYPNHPRRFMSSQSNRKRWKKVGETWVIAEGNIESEAHNG